MRNVQFNKKAIVIYLILTFGLAYIIQICAASLYEKNRVIGQLVTAAMMFVPALGAVLSGAKLKEMGWKPQIRKNIKIFLIAWFGSMILNVVGAALYFLIFPKHFDISGEYFVAAGGAEALEQMKAQGISYSVYLLITLVSSISYAPLLNMFVALGEEIGWRGFMYPQLKARFGRRKGWILGGVIWGAWHWPLIWLIGYEYGAAAGNPIGYAGFPITGMLLFCVITIGLGILHDWLYEKSESIWVPALFHGALNAAATLPLAVCQSNTGSFRLLGPAPNGILSGLPILAVAAILLINAEKSRGKLQ